MLKWIITPSGEKISVEDAINGALSEFYPMPYIMMCASEREWKGKPSTTQLINGTRLEFLRILTPYAIDPDDQAFRIIGTRGHGKLENFAPPESFAELQMSEDEISGIADLLEKSGDEWVITDYKTWGSYKVGLALGLEKKQRPKFDQDGNPEVYKSSGKWGKAGSQKTETYYEPNPDKVSIPETELQINRYRYAIEKAMGITISKMKVFCIARDGGTFAARNNGVFKNTFFIDIKELDPVHVQTYFTQKRDALLNALNDYENSYTAKHGKSWQEGEPDDELIKELAPPICNKVENWDGRRCEKYCSVSEACSKLGNPFLT